MNKKEKQFANILRKYFTQEKFFVDTIESRMTAAGIPDLLVLSPKGNQSLIELKVVEADNIISLTPGQKAWHSRRIMRHCPTKFIILFEERNQILIASGRRVMEWVLDKGGKVDIEKIPEECWFDRKAADYSLLPYQALDLYFYSDRVYK